MLSFIHNLWALDTIKLDLTVQGIKEAGAPKIVDGVVIFTYQTDTPVKFVGARFENEEYKKLHLYEVNKNNIFVLIYIPPHNIKKLRYRITVDGLWIKDPFNPNKEYDSTGTVFSTVTLPQQRDIYKPGVTIKSNGYVQFVLQTRTGRNVYITGDFNKWDPFMDRMEEVKKGIYSTQLHLLPGRHYYYFIVDGEKLLDPINVDIRRDYEGFAVSSFYIPENEVSKKQ